MSGFRVRKVNKADEALVRSVAGAINSCVGLPFSPDSADVDISDIDLHYRQTGGEFWVLDCDGAIAGGIGLLRNNNGTELRRFFLAPGMRGIGIGRLLFETAFTYVREKQLLPLYVVLIKEFKHTLAILQSLGFSEAVAPSGLVLPEESLFLQLHG